ncbi:MAG: hypothetical protein HUJ79_06380 [Firmicutes bacterium]|nr:hypothetical protein [Bacillota bacterium]
MANRYKKKRETTNKTKDWITDYYQTGREWEKDNRRRREEAGEKEEKGLKNLNSFERGCIIVIGLALLGMFIKYVLLGHGFWTPGM